MPVPTPSVFISHRLSDTGELARRLRDRLTEAFGPESVLWDSEDISTGADFYERISEILASVDLVMVLIGLSWSRRLDDPYNSVRHEVAVALDQDVSVLTVLVDGALMPPAWELPGSLSPLSLRQAFKIRTDAFYEDVEGLIDVMRTLPVSSDGNKEPSTPARIGGTPVKFGQCSLEKQTEEALNLAWEGSSGFPVDARGILEAVSLLEETAGSPAFSKFTALAPMNVDRLAESNAQVESTATPIDLDDYPMVVPLAKSFFVAEEFIREGGIFGVVTS